VERREESLGFEHWHHTDGYFRMYGMQPVLSRSFLASDHKQDSEPVCVSGENFWREELQGNASVIGDPLNLDGKTCTPS
jgi:hypothetical protein